MSQFLCHNCGVSASLVPSSSPVNPLGTPEQRNKFHKHTTTSSALSNNLRSIFNNPAIRNYKKLLGQTYRYGCVEIDDRGHNLLWSAGSTIGATYQNGTLISLDDTMKVVLPNYIDYVHGYSTASATNLQSRYCQSCGCPLI